MWILKTITEELPERTFRILSGGMRTIGRSTGADFIVDAALVSRVHCRLSALAERRSRSARPRQHQRHVRQRRAGRDRPPVVWRSSEGGARRARGDARTGLNRDRYASVRGSRSSLRRLKPALYVVRQLLDVSGTPAQTDSSFSRARWSCPVRDPDERSLRPRGETAPR